MKTPATANLARFACVLAFPLSGITSTLPAEASFERAYSDRAVPPPYRRETTASSSPAIPDGELIWRKNIDASPHDWASSVQSAADGGYYVLGTTRPSQGDEDVLLVKTDADGNPEWQKTFGTPDWQESGISLTSFHR